MMSKTAVPSGHGRSCAPKTDRRRGRRVCGVHCPASAKGSCPRASTHVGMIAGVAMMEGCLWHVRRWVKFGWSW